MIQIIYNILSIIFILWMSFKWSTEDFFESMIKVFLFLLAIVGIFLSINLLKL